MNMIGVIKVYSTRNSKIVKLQNTLTKCFIYSLFSMKMELKQITNIGYLQRVSKYLILVN